MHNKINRYGVAVIENAFVDVLSNEVREEDLVALGLVKGTSAMLNGKAADLNRYFVGHNLKIIAGGAGANVAAHCGNTGAKTAFLGTVGNDKFGDFAKSEFLKCGVEPFLARKAGDTGVCYSLVTPDAERTMVFDPGNALDYSVDDLKVSVIESTKLLHTSLYALVCEPQRTAVLCALKIAKKAGAKISCDLANAPIVAGNREFVRKLLADYIDIVVANEDEAVALSGSIEEAQFEMEYLCETSIVKLGANGSMITHCHEVYKIPVFPAKVVDTTGAGDSYIGTYLGYIAQGASVEEAGIAASKKASEIVSRIGAR